MSRSAPFWIFTAFMLSVLGVASSCHSTSQPHDPPAPGTILSAFGIAEDVAPEATVKPHVDIFLDGTETMAGFVTPYRSAYKSVLDDLLSLAPGGGYPSSVQIFSDDVRPVQNPGSKDLLKPGFYTGLVTSLPRVLEKVGESVAQGRIALIISDLVQSEDDKNGRELAEQLQHAFGYAPGSKPRDVLLLAWRSSFNGKYTREAPLPPNAKKNIFPSIDGDGKPNGRPFYLIVAAPDASAMQIFNRLVLSKFRTPWQEEFPVSRVPLAVADVRAELMPNARQTSGRAPDGRLWQPFNKSRYSASSRLFFGEYYERSTPNAARAFELVLSGNFGRPLASYANLKFTQYRTAFRGGSSEGVTATRELEPAASYDEKNATVRLRYVVPAITPGTWTAYHIQTRVGEGNGAAPAWVADWSTTDDSSQDEANRTYNFDRLCSVLVSAISENVLISDQVLLFGRGE